MRPWRNESRRTPCVCSHATGDRHPLWDRTTKLDCESKDREGLCLLVSSDDFLIRGYRRLCTNANLRRKRNVTIGVARSRIFDSVDLTGNSKLCRIRKSIWISPTSVTWMTSTSRMSFTRTSHHDRSIWKTEQCKTCRIIFAVIIPYNWLTRLLVTNGSGLVQASTIPSGTKISVRCPNGLGYELSLEKIWTEGALLRFLQCAYRGH